MQRERGLWDGLDFTNRSHVKIKETVGDGKFTVRLVDHVAAIDDEATLLAAALVLSYSIAESAATESLGLDSRQVTGIEDWGARLLAANGRDWSLVDGGLAGAVEVAVIRNLIVHGADRVDNKSHARLVRAGCSAMQLGSPVVLEHPIVGTYRARLRSLLMAGGLGR